jgi:hypothetical protein
MEGVELLHDAIAWIKRRRLRTKELAVRKELAEVFPAGEVRLRTESKSDHPRWVKRFTRIGLIVVVVGVVAEWRCGAKLEDAHNAVHEYDLAKLTEADQKAGDAAKSAKDVHDLGTDLLEKYKVAERELVALQARTAPRRLSSKQKQFLDQRVSAFTTKTIVIMCIEEWGTEIKDFAQDFFEACNSPTLGFKVEPPICALEWVDPIPFPPIKVTAGAERQHDADVLIKTLIEVGINKNSIVREPNNNNAVLLLIIGPRPK